MPCALISIFKCKNLKKKLFEIILTLKQYNFYKFQICNNNLPLCHTFILQCLKDKKWTLWIIKLPPTLQPNALRLLLPVLFKLRSEKNV